MLEMHLQEVCHCSELSCSKLYELMRLTKCQCLARSAPNQCPFAYCIHTDTPYHTAVILLPCDATFQIIQQSKNFQKFCVIQK